MRDWSQCGRKENRGEDEKSIAKKMRRRGEERRRDGGYAKTGEERKGRCNVV